MAEQTFEKTYKYRLYPTKSQQDTLEKRLSLYRWLYNHFLEKRKDAYKKEKTCLKKGKAEFEEKK